VAAGKPRGDIRKAVKYLLETEVNKHPRLEGWENTYDGDDEA
jgi:hypothetical protein